MFKMHVIFSSVLISSLFISVSAIKCYNCESSHATECGYVFDSEEGFEVNCDRRPPPRYMLNSTDNLNATACIKKVYKEHSVTKYIRSCYYGDVNDTDTGCLMDPSLMDVQDVECFVCADDFCNTAAWNGPQKGWSSLCTLLMFVLMAKILNMKNF
ncbi:uncharacterized protein LOC106096321 [Stomoxys calcitrans]|uniref:Uncharacterized protein n=1 Tax=Stomoxys calcitrans TaxID=35570 RepID=A0A1I8PJM0_STOCA|nr:uncharacterized protein LOC106096321 [Stomoxys calcitrans]